MTPLEQRTLLAFRQGLIHLTGLPGFMQETHTLKESMAWQRVYRTHMRHRLYVETPPNVRLPMESPTWHLFQKIISKNQDNGAPSALVVRLMTDVSVVNCSPESNLVEFIFDRPETRAKWIDQTIAFPFGTISLRASDAFSREDTSLGYDAVAMRLMYEVQLLGFRHAKPELVLAIAEELGQGTAVLDIEPVEPTGERCFDPYVWKITYESFTAPAGVDKLRCLLVNDGTTKSKVGVHHPRVARMHPCSKCLGLGHRRAKCTSGPNTDELRAPFTRMLNLTLPPLCDMALPELTLEALTAQAARIRQQLEPGLAKGSAAKTRAPGNKPTKVEVPPPNGVATARAWKSKSAATSPSKTVVLARQQVADQLRALHAHLIRTTAARRTDSVSGKPKSSSAADGQAGQGEPTQGPRNPSNKDKVSAPARPVPEAGAQTTCGLPSTTIHPPAPAQAPSGATLGDNPTTAGSPPNGASQRASDPSARPQPSLRVSSNTQEHPAEVDQGTGGDQKPSSEPGVQGKRRRASTILGPGDTSSKPTNRQARANTAHRAVTVLPSAVFLRPTDPSVASRVKASAPRL